jgi:hypothetical protein
MQGTRKVEGCLNCGEVREIAAHGLCFKCYRKKEREDDRKFHNVNRHNPGIRREHRNLFRGFNKVMLGLSDLQVSRTDIDAVRRVIEPYLSPIASLLGPQPQRDDGEGSEQ